MKLFDNWALEVTLYNMFNNHLSYIQCFNVDGGIHYWIGEKENCGYA
jgi:hypothetical protein